MFIVNYQPGTDAVVELNNARIVDVINVETDVPVASLCKPMK